MYGEIHGEKYMANELKDFLGSIKKSDLARPNRYRVEVYGPQNYLAPDLDLRCESISFPGSNIRSVPDTLRFGPPREHGQALTYGPFTATFICGSDMKEKRYFEAWQESIVNKSTWEVRYYDNYKGSLKIFQLDRNNYDRYAIEVKEAYPKTISPQDVGWNNNDSYQTVAVEFTYRYWLPDKKLAQSAIYT